MKKEQTPNSLKIQENWTKGLTLSKQEISSIKAGEVTVDGPTCGEVTINSKQRQTVPSRSCPC